jgi:hypothetical protein
MKYKYFIIGILLVFPFLGKGQTCTIDFDEFTINSVQNNECEFNISGIDLTMWNQTGDSCFFPSEFASVKSFLIKKEDIPWVSNSETSIQIGGCVMYVFIIYNNNITESLYNPGTFVLSNFENLHSITFSDIECPFFFILNGVNSTHRKIHITNTPIPSPPPPTCNDTEIQDLENNLNAGITTCDYHQYIIEDIICDKTNYSGANECSVDGVFNFIKSNNNYQAPGKFDFPLAFGIYSEICDPNVSGCVWNPDITTLHFDPFSILGKADPFSSGPYNIPILDCMEMDLHPSFQRQLIGVSLGLSHFTDDLIFDLDFFDSPCMNSINWFREPIKIVIDDERRCITNYTMPGHILHPGKVERCVVLDDCGQKIKIVTKGVGYHECQNDWRGAFFSCMNSTMGPYIFHSVSNRIKDEF